MGIFDIGKNFVEDLINVNPKDIAKTVAKAGAAVTAAITPIVGIPALIAINNLSDYSICVLGPLKAGKTTFLNWLRKGCFFSPYCPTNREPYETFSYKKKKIHSGEDIGGGNEFKFEYIDMIAKCNVCIFVFDTNQFINDNSYRQEIWDTADLIYRNAQVLGKTVCTIGTHLDLTDYPNGDRLREKIYQLSERKPFKDIFHTNCMVVDLTNQQYFAACAKLIFGV
ncbi:MAG: GTPase domain-containing protein [Bacteroidales bacterium]|nr:GTPase domain-containing protein [Bacteroidales bacterium]